MRFYSFYKYFLLLTFLVVVGSFARAQSIVNGYAKVTAISGSSILSVSNVNISNHAFAAGENLLIMQMQDNVIGSNTTNISSFGNVSSVLSAGLFEVKKVLSVSPSSGTPTTITLDSQVGNTYNIGTNTSVQVITFRNLGANYTTTASITGLTWDGNVGGVVAIEVTNTLTLRHSIIANGIGFSGGAQSSSADEACTNTVYITNSNLKAYKGEGIYNSTNSNFTNGRAKIINGGGGGAQNNSGGGGGSNYTAGGAGGVGWSCSAANSGYGIGGVALSTYISGTRIFMGGGGGGGQQNNGIGTNGAAGGGIILIKAGTVVSSTTCVSSISIAANGANAADSGNDGAGGGGGGGSIVLQAASFGLSATCPLTVSANGGRGGSVTNSGEHGGGGGGGQGVLIYSGAQPTANVTSQTNVGIGGANSSSSGSTSAGNGAGTNGSGITSGSLTVLPIKLMDFYGSINENKSVVLTWHTASEKNCKEFVVERSADGTNYSEITTVPAHGTTSSAHEYKAYDQLISSNLYYYRLRSVDFDSGEEISPLIAISAISNPQFVVYPNPVDKNKSLVISLREKASGSEQIQLLDMFGNCQVSILCTASQEQVEIDLAHYNLLAGVYFIKLQGLDYSITKKLLLNN